MRLKLLVIRDTAAHLLQLTNVQHVIWCSAEEMGQLNALTRALDRFSDRLHVAEAQWKARQV
jgi:hypothetical protein